MFLVIVWLEGYTAVLVLYFLIDRIAFSSINSYQLLHPLYAFLQKRITLGHIEVLVTVALKAFPQHGTSTSMSLQEDVVIRVLSTVSLGFKN